MPPSMGAAMRPMTSEPVPLPQTIGTSRLGSRLRSLLWAGHAGLPLHGFLRASLSFATDANSTGTSAHHIGQRLDPLAEAYGSAVKNGASASAAEFAAAHEFFKGKKSKTCSA